MSKNKLSVKVLSYSALNLLALLSCWICFQVYTPRISAVAYRILPDVASETSKGPSVAVDETWIAAAHPVYVFTPESRFEIRLRLAPSLLPVRRWQILPDDCVEALTVNGVSVPLPAQHRVCDWRGGFTVDLTPYLGAADNDVRAVLKNSGGQGSLSITPASSDVFVVIMRILMVACVVAVVVGWVFLFFDGPLKGACILLCVAGVVLRIVYMFVTPHYVRAYDTSGHVEYLEFMLSQWRIPPHNLGWQTYQPPLYYVVVAAVAWVLRVAGTNAMLFQIAQAVSCFFAVTACVVGTLFLRRLSIDCRLPTGAFVTAASLWAVLPALVFSSSRISNDVLLNLFVVLVVSLLWQAYSAGSRSAWWWAVICFALASVTKSTSITVAPLMAMVLVLSPQLSFRQRLFRAATTVTVILALVGWYYLGRFTVEAQPDLVGNILSNHPGLRVESGIKNFLIFNPIAILELPYNNTWNDEFRRANVWEFFYRSLFFGEFSFGSEARLFASWLMALGFIEILVLFFGVWRVVNTQAAGGLFMATLGLGMLAALVTVRAFHNISGFSDARYIPSVALAFGYFIAHGQLALPPLFARIASWAHVTLCAGCVGLFAYLVFADPRLP